MASRPTASATAAMPSVARGPSNRTSSAPRNVKREDGQRDRGEGSALALIYFENEIGDEHAIGLQSTNTTLAESATRARGPESGPPNFLFIRFLDSMRTARQTGNELDRIMLSDSPHHTAPRDQWRRELHGRRLALDATGSRMVVPPNGVDPHDCYTPRLERTF